MATAHRKTERAKSNTDEIVIDSSFWQNLPKREIFTQDELRAKGYRNSVDLAPVFGVAPRHVKPYCERIGLAFKRFATKYSGQVREMDWFYKPAGK